MDLILQLAIPQPLQKQHFKQRFDLSHKCVVCGLLAPRLDPRALPAGWRKLVYDVHLYEADILGVGSLCGLLEEQSKPLVTVQYSFWICLNREGTFSFCHVLPRDQYIRTLICLLSLDF